jgi:hypothetical protein
VVTFLLRNCLGQEARMKLWVRDPDGVSPLGRSRLRGEDNIQIQVRGSRLFYD